MYDILVDHNSKSHISRHYKCYALHSYAMWVIDKAKYTLCFI